MRLRVFPLTTQASQTRQMLERRSDVIASHLKQLDPTHDRETLKIFVGCEDFLKGGDIAANFCMDPKTVYECIADDMRALSRLHPGVVLCDDTTAPFDFVIHSSVGGDVPDAMRKKARWYVHSDFGGSSKVLTSESASPLIPICLEDPDSDHELFVYY